MTALSWLPELVAAVLASVVAITLHEAAHGYAALSLGDDTAKRMGRLSLNPLRHVDPVGTVLVPGVLLVGQLLTMGKAQFLFGWAKPVPVNVPALKNPRMGMVLVAAAGPATNFFLAWVSALLMHLIPGLAQVFSPESAAWVYDLLWFSILANLVLGLFNLLPVPPLDGGRILAGLLPARFAVPYMRLEPFGLLVVIAALFVLPSLADGFDPVRWALLAAVEDGFHVIRLLSFHRGGGA